LDLSVTKCWEYIYGSGKDLAEEILTGRRLPRLQIRHESLKRFLIRIMFLPLAEVWNEILPKAAAQVVLERGAGPVEETEAAPQ
jgi:hypothetical protein